MIAFFISLFTQKHNNKKFTIYHITVRLYKCFYIYVTGVIVIKSVLLEFFKHFGHSTTPEICVEFKLTEVFTFDLIMADSDSDDILSADFLEPGELLDSDDERPDSISTSARTSQAMPLNRPKVCLNISIVYVNISHIILI